MYGILLVLHVLGATIWTGGHMVLATAVLPGVLREQAPDKLLAFESKFERIGMPALIVQIVTGLLLAHHLLPDVAQWVNFANPVTHVIAAKLGLLAVTFLFALDAKLRVIPRLQEPGKLRDMAWHIVPVTLMSILFVVVGVSVRTGWLY